MVKKVTVVHWEDSEGAKHKTERDAIMILTYFWVNTLLPS